MRNGVSRCARSHDATRQRDAVKRRCSGRGTLRQTPDPVSFPACSPASFSACPPVRLQSMRFSGQLRSRSRQSPAEGGSDKPLHRKRIFSFPGPPVPASSCPHPVGTQGTAVPRASGFPAPPAALPPVPSHLPDHFPTSPSLRQFPPCWLPLLPFRPISPATRRSRRQPGRRRGSPFPASRRLLRAWSPRLPRSESSLTIIDNHSQSVPNMPKGQRATCAPDAWERRRSASAILSVPSGRVQPLRQSRSISG